MPCTREELEERERQFLAPYAQLSGQTRGRAYPESDTQSEFRTHYQRDRDRVIHSRAFRRLEYKTQVFLNGTGDHLRTRLTHSIEVAGIARNIARALKLNDDLAETIALAHDLGHAPFGHKGEEILNELMKEEGGFEHNLQSLRIVEELEQKYPGFPGLNLTWETREGLLKHHTDVELVPRAGNDSGFVSLSLEAQVANLADEIAYYTHDLDDGIDAGLLSESQLEADVEIWRWAARQVEASYGHLPDPALRDRRYFIVRCIIDAQVKDVVNTSELRIGALNIQTSDDARQSPEPVIQYSAERAEANQQLRSYLYQNLYYNPRVRQPNDRAALLLEHLFHHYVEHPETIGDQAKKRIPHSGLKRVLCDYLSGMTDRYVMQEYQRLFGKIQ